MKYFLYMSACTALTLGGCSNDGNLMDHVSDSTSNVYMPQALQTPAVFTFNRDDTQTELIYGACFGGPHANNKDILVEFSPAPGLVSSFNNQYFTNYPVMPAGSYELEQSSAAIPSGKVNTPPLKVRLHLDKLEGIGGYLLPVTIQSSNKLNDRLKTTYFLVKALYTSNPFPELDRSAWEVAGFSSEEPTGDGANNGKAIYAIDPSASTWWSTTWKASKPGPPHVLTIDMHATQKLHGFSITGRLDAAGNFKTSGNPKGIIVETSIDGTTWSYNESFTLENIKENTFYLSYAQEARYFRMTINTSQGDIYLTHIGDLKAF